MFVPSSLILFVAFCGITRGPVTTCLLRSYPDVARFCFGSTGFSVVALIMTSQSLDALGSWDLGCFPVDANVTNGGYRIMGQILSFNSDV